jgi:AcrR family transcriptional regulator
LPPQPPGISRREQAKGERRARVVAAAWQILREEGVDGLSMKAVAGRAGVSLATLYNLFGSKGAVLAGVYEQDLRNYEALVAARPGDALDRIFDAVDVAARLYGADPDFYRAIMWRRDQEMPQAMVDIRLNDPRARFWPDLVARAVEAGALRAGTDPTVLGVLMMQSLGGVISDWLGDRISLERLPLEAKLAFAIMLSAFATGEASLRLRKQVQTLHRRLSLEPRRSASLDPSPPAGEAGPAEQARTSGRAALSG